VLSKGKKQIGLSAFVPFENFSGLFWNPLTHFVAKETLNGPNRSENNPWDAREYKI